MLVVIENEVQYMQQQQQQLWLQAIPPTQRHKVDVKVRYLEHVCSLLPLLITGNSAFEYYMPEHDLPHPNGVHVENAENVVAEM